jgi:hypothetical protein
MDDSVPLRLMIVEAVNECNDADLLDLIYKLLVYDENSGGKSAPTAVFILSK